MIGGYTTLLIFVLSAIVIGQPSENANVGDRRTTNPPPPLGQKQKDEAIKAFETSLLKLFGLSSRPRPTKDIVIPQYMIDLYKKDSNDPDDIPHYFKVTGRGLTRANTIRSFYHDDVVHSYGCEEEYCSRLYFNTSNFPADEDLTGAELRIYVEKNFSVGEITPRKLKQRIEIYEIMKPVFKKREPIVRLIDVKDIVIRNSSWFSLDVHPAVLKWKNAPHKNYGLEIRTLPHSDHPSHSPHKHVRLRRSASLEESQWHSQRPLLVTFSDDNRSKSVRTKRSTDDSSESRKNKKRQKRRKRRKNKRKNKDKKNKTNRERRKGHKDQCRRHDLYVNFSDVGWNDWIVAPLGYQAYYCAGNCPFPLADHLNATNHAVVQTLVHSVDPRAVPTACCVPTDLSAISMLYLDEHGKVVLKKYNEMVVEGCGCR